MLTEDSYKSYMMWASGILKTQLYPANIEEKTLWHDVTCINTNSTDTRSLINVIVTCCDPVMTETQSQTDIFLLVRHRKIL